MRILSPLSTKANLNLRQTGLKDPGIKAIKWLLSAPKPPPMPKCRTRVVQYHLTLDHVMARWRARITSFDRSDSRWRIHPRPPQSNPTLPAPIRNGKSNLIVPQRRENAHRGKMRDSHRLMKTEKFRKWNVMGVQRKRPARSPASWCSPIETVLMECSYTPTWGE